MFIIADYIQSIIPTIMVVVAQSILAILGVCFVRLINKLLKKTGIEIDEKVMQEIEDIVFKAVSITNQLLTDNYKEKSSDHKLSDEQKEEVFNHTKDIIMSSLSTEQLRALVNKYGIDAEEAIKLLIENTVYWNRNNTKE